MSSFSLWPPPCRLSCSDGCHCCCPEPPEGDDPCSKCFPTERWLQLLLCICKKKKCHHCFTVSLIMIRCSRKVFHGWCFESRVTLRCSSLSPSYVCISLAVSNTAPSTHTLAFLFFFGWWRTLTPQPSNTSHTCSLQPLSAVTSSPCYLGYPVKHLVTSACIRHFRFTSSACFSDAYVSPERACVYARSRTGKLWYF